MGLGLGDDVVVTFPRGYYKDIEAELSVPKILEAPLALGDEVGELTLRLNGETIFETPLLALQAVPEAGIFGRMGDFISLFFSQLFSDD